MGGSVVQTCVHTDHFKMPRGHYLDYGAHQPFVRLALLQALQQKQEQHLVEKEKTKSEDKKDYDIMMGSKTYKYVQPLLGVGCLFHPKTDMCLPADEIVGCESGDFWAVRTV